MTGYYDGKLLVAPPTMRDRRFARSVVYIWKHDVSGACGTIINRPLEEPTFQHVCTESKIPCVAGVDPTLFWGGPVMENIVGCLHTLDYSISTTNTHSEHLGFTMDRTVINDIALGRGPENCIITMGMATWDSGQLEEELTAPPPRSRNESWLILDYDPNLIWHGENDELWTACVNMAAAQHSREFTSKLLRD